MKQKRLKRAWLVLPVALAVALACMFGACSAQKGQPDESTAAGTTVSTVADTTAAGVTEPAKTTEQTTEADKSSTAAPKKKTTTTKKQANEKPGNYSVKAALDALENYYGDGYAVNGTVSEGDDYFFAVYKNDKKYASVKINLKTGDTEETLTATGEKNTFNVFV